MASPETGSILAALPFDLRIAVRAAPALSSAGTAITTLVAVPALEVLLVVAIGRSATGAFDLTSAVAAVVVAFGAAVCGGTVDAITRDRNLGILSQVLRHGWLNLRYWTMKVAVGCLSGIATAIAMLAALYLTAPDEALASAPAWSLAAAAALLACLVGGVLGIAAAISTLSTNDPYLVGNLLSALSLIGTGVVAPISAYPPVIRELCLGLPFTHTVEALRQDALWPEAAWEMLVLACWATVAAAVALRAVARYRSGEIRELVW